MCIQHLQASLGKHTTKQHSWVDMATHVAHERIRVIMPGSVDNFKLSTVDEGIVIPPAEGPCPRQRSSPPRRRKSLHASSQAAPDGPFVARQARPGC